MTIPVLNKSPTPDPQRFRETPRNSSSCLFATRFRPKFDIPRACRRTPTVDNGKEFARFKRIEARTGLDVFFVDPYAAWQRGIIENTNGLLRQYFPKGTNFRSLSDEDLEPPPDCSIIDPESASPNRHHTRSL